VTRLAVAVALVLGLALAAPAAAFTPPELFVRQQRWDTHEETGSWLPLASAPTFGWVGGYEIGYRLQASGQPNQFQRVALTVTGVPDGQPTQPSLAEPYCVGQAGTAGTIVPAGAELQFEGSGTYTVQVSVGANLDCTTTGQMSSGSFRVDFPVAATLTGSPVRFRAQPLDGDPFAGVRPSATPPGGYGDVRCARDAVIGADGSVTGAFVTPEPDPEDPVAFDDTIPETQFPRPGAWTCVARGVASGVDDTFDSALFGTPWSAPIAFDVLSDFRRGGTRMAHRRARKPRFGITAEWPAEATGGEIRLTLFRACTRKKVAAGTAQFGADKARIRVKRPRRRGFYAGVLSFGGTHFLRPSTDPSALLLFASKRKIGFVSPLTFPQC
jgi:hypothetical protein